MRQTGILNISSKSPISGSEDAAAFLKSRLPLMSEYPKSLLNSCSPPLIISLPSRPVNPMYRNSGFCLSATFSTLRFSLPFSGVHIRSKRRAISCVSRSVISAAIFTTFTCELTILSLACAL